MKRSREEFEKDEQQQINSESIKIITTTEEEIGSPPTQSKFPFCDDICFEISQYLTSFFVLNNCVLISKQWLRVVKERPVQLTLNINTFKEESREALMHSQFLENIVEIKEWSSYTPFLSTTISEMKQLKILNISFHILGDEEAVKLLSCELKQLTCLNISGNRLKYTTSVCELKQLTNLDISRNWIGDMGVKSILGLTQLTTLIIHNNYIGDRGGSAIGELKQLTHLNISGNKMKSTRSIRRLTQVTNLNVSGNRINDKGVKYLNELKQLTILDISKNQISVEGVKSISEMIQLTNLDICCNEIGLEGANFIGKLKQLTSLTISRNLIGEGGINNSVLAGLTQLKKLKISGNQNW